ncbi:MAG TPA: molybdate ABC transporter substrate-binding protein [Propionicimonas sp.]|nr:molybdate ABC transporter substrate-binding protein [Propionicimonas sp.]HQA77643.1 molybdate ABC transporter substrate-binding protein [Propionicimonas sp.]HQD97540.1 molybdate ABC transporter substrate-binding protein [Propionicimonas sp.]
MKTCNLCAGLAAALLLTSCASTQPAAGGSELVVFAAASLNGTFTELGKEFEASHAGTTVKFSFDGSSALVDQLKQGAPADVFASADRSNMDKAVAAGVITGAPEQFTSNVLTIIVPTGNPAAITGLDDSLTGKKLVVCANGVPCGSATVKLAEALGVTLSPVSEETKVTDVRTKVESGQADAGIVYVTDAKASADLVESIPIQGADKARNDYLIGVAKDAKQAALAAEFIALVKGSRGQEVLKAAGFGE